MEEFKKVQQNAVVGIYKPFAYLYLLIYVWLVYTGKLLSCKMGIIRYFVILKRLLMLVKVLYPNKVMKINGKYRFQLYLPSFPSKSFFHALNKYDPANKQPGPITVVFSMTKACTYKCPHCYQGKDSGPELDIEILKDTAKKMMDLGVALFDIEGGEPLIRFDRTIELLEAFDERAELWINTTGHALTLEKAKKLKEVGLYGVMVSIHSADEQEYNEFTGVPDAYKTAVKAIKMFQEIGIVTAINFCPRTDDVSSDGVEKLLELSRELNVSLVQVIHGKSAGQWLYKTDSVYSSSDMIDKLVSFHHKYNESSLAKDYPSILFQVFEESPHSFGCTAGGIDRFYLNHEGEVQPCEFINVSFGNVKDEDFFEIFKRMRSFFKKPGTNWLCCSESASIGELIKEKDLKKTPIPNKLTQELVKKWDKGNDTKLYTDLGIYDK